MYNRSLVLVRRLFIYNFNYQSVDLRSDDRSSNPDVCYE